MEQTMDLMEAMHARHSVRRYKAQPLAAELIDALQAEIDACNQAGGLHIQLVTNEPKAFSGMMARYGKFSGVTNYIAMIGKKAPDLDEKCGYYGERLVLRAQQLGLNTCWVAMTYSKVKTAYTVAPDEKLCIVIALGYGENQGASHAVKTIEQVSQADGPLPDWFRSGVQAALLAQTAMNQQKSRFVLRGGRVAAIVDELRGEKIDIVNYSESPESYIANALAPAEVIDVAMLEDEHSCRVTVPESQLSLAIGKEGQNARLAAKLTGFKIDIKAEG